MPYQLLALDLDGTVMGHDLIIPAAVRNGVARLRQAGVHVTIATGRMFAATRPYAEELGIDEAVICYQGAMVRHMTTRATIAHFPMPAAPAAEATAVLLEQDLFVVAYIDEKLCVARERPELDLYLRYHPHEVEVIIDPHLPERVAALPPTKLLFVAEPDIVGRALAELDEQFGDRLITTRSHQLFGELTAPGVSKGAALAALAANLGVDRSEVVAIGDQENDVSMVAWAGLGLAMGNAVESVRAVAAAVLPPVDQAGVAYAIERYFADL